MHFSPINLLSDVLDDVTSTMHRFDVATTHLGRGQQITVYIFEEKRNESQFSYAYDRLRPAEHAWGD
jgi:hypothetical protein